MKSDAPVRFAELDGLRGLAALTVFFSHAVGTLPSSPLLDALKSSPLRTTWDGAAAVGLFFVLSGFVLALAFVRDHKTLSYRDFLIRRCFRIFPAYWIALLLALILNFAAFNPNGLLGLSDWVTSLWANPIRLEDILRHIPLVVPLDTHRIDPVIWTMVFEMKISVIFPFAIVTLRTLPSAWGSAIVLVGAIAITGFGTAHRVMFLEALPEFVAGAILAQHSSRVIYSIRRWPFAVIASLLVVSLALYGKWLPLNLVEQYPRSSFHVSAIGGLMLITLTISWQPLGSILKTGVYQSLGRISYSFYLVHLPILLASLSLIYPILHSAMLTASIALIVSLVFGSIMNKFIEIPAQNFGRIFTVRGFSLSTITFALRKKQTQR